MTKKIDRYIFIRLTLITLLVLFVLIFIFIVLHYSDNNEYFIDNGATPSEIFGIYYLNYIPEIVRLIIPLAAFVACLYLTGQMADRLEITALKAAGVSLYRLSLPYLAFAFLTGGLLSYLDGFVIPGANAKRIAFEKQYLKQNTKKIDRNQIYRQESDSTIVRVSFFNSGENTAYNVEVITLEGDSIKTITNIQRMNWLDESEMWRMVNIERRQFLPQGLIQTRIDTIDTTLSILPRDFARRTSDIYQLTYPEAQDYIASIERSGATGANLPKIQFYGRLTYPLSIIIVTVIGFSIAAVRRRGGKGFHIAAGLTISFLYLAMMKIFEPFGAQGGLDPIAAAALPHLFFLTVGVGLLVAAKK